MKKVIFISALAIAAAVSCTKSDIVDTKFNEQISFETYVGRDAMTKAAVEDATTVDKIGVYGYYTGKSVWNEETTANLWDAVLPLTVADNGVGSVGEGNERYWANPDDNYTFLAYGPYDKVTAPVSTKNPTLEYTVSPDLGEQVDVLYATKVSGTTTELNGTVGLNMKHALSRITVKASSAAAKFNFDVKEVSIEGKFNVEGKLPLATGVWAPTKNEDAIYVIHRNGTVNDDKFTPVSYVAQNALPAAANAIDYSAYTYYTPSDNPEAPTAVVVEDNYLMIIPTQFTEDTPATLTVKYTTYYMGAESVLIEKTFPITTDFLPGKAYAFNLEFDKDEKEIEFTVTVDNWDDAANDDADDDNDLYDEDEFEDNDETVIPGGNPENWNQTDDPEEDDDTQE